MNFQTNGGHKVTLTGCWKSLDTDTQSTDSEVVAGHKVPHWKNVDLVNELVQSRDNMCCRLTVWSVNLTQDRHSVKVFSNYHHEFGNCLLLEHSIICKKCNKYEHFKFLKVVHILSVVGNVICSFVWNLTDFPAVKKFGKSLKIWRNYRHNRWQVFFETQFISMPLMKCIQLQKCLRASHKHKKY